MYSNWRRSWTPATQKFQAKDWEKSKYLRTFLEGWSYRFGNIPEDKLFNRMEARRKKCLEKRHSGRVAILLSKWYGWKLCCVDVWWWWYKVSLPLPCQLVVYVVSIVRGSKKIIDYLSSLYSRATVPLTKRKK